jgi:bacterioferritin-associated ferredoxin
MSGELRPQPATVRGLTIDRCVCRKRSFADLLRLARAGGWDRQRLSAETGAGVQCGLCLPYIGRMLRTGESRFHEILLEEDR